MIGKKVKVISGKHAGRTALVIGNLPSQNAWKVQRVYQMDNGWVNGELFQVSKFYVEEIKEVVPAAKLKPKYKVTTAVDFILPKGSYPEIEFGPAKPGELYAGWISDAWVEDGEVLYNIVFAGEFAVVKEDGVQSRYHGRPYHA